MSPPRKMPKALSLLGFNEEEWAAFQEWKGAMGDVQDVIDQMTALNKEIKTGLAQIAIITEMMYRLHPNEYRQAAAALGIRLEG